MSAQVDFAREHGYVETVLGRRRYLKDINSRNAMVRSGAERNAVNAPIQGSAADVMMMAMLKLHRNERLKEMGWEVILQIMASLFAR